MITLQDIGAAWNALFHAVEPADTIALFRILVGSLLVVNACSLPGRRVCGSGPTACLRLEPTASYGHSRLSLLRYLPATNASVVLVLGLHLIAAVGLTIGLLTPWSAALAYVSLASLHHRNPLVT